MLFYVFLTITIEWLIPKIFFRIFWGSSFEGGAWAHDNDMGQMSYLLQTAGTVN